jgi:hypothetical protein
MEEHLTNQKISKKFSNQFDLVNYAILLVENLIKSGRAPRVKVDVDNPVVQILAEIDAGKDKLEDLVIEPINDDRTEYEEPKLTLSKEKNKFTSPKNTEKRKTRIMH